MFRHTGARSLDDLDRGKLADWCTAPTDQRWNAGTRRAPANNTVRKRAHTVKAFIGWLEQEGHLDPSARLAAALSKRGGPIAAYRPTYGKVQSVNPGRWLTHAEAFDTLCGSCKDGTVVGLRDEIVIRLGLQGMRCSEIRNLRVGDFEPRRPELRWTGKGNKPRQAVPGPALVTLLVQYLDLYADALNVKHLDPDLPMICQRPGNRGRHLILWGIACPSKDTITKTVVRIAEAAGLGHVTPHDLRRSAAGILHDATTSDGAHHFDLLDIQRVLDHSDPAVTMKCYISPRDNGAKRRASGFLD